VGLLSHRNDDPPARYQQKIDTRVWGSAQVCNFIDVTGLLSRLAQAQTPSGQCVCSNSYGAGVIFWVLMAMVAVLVIGRVSRR
jgi:hypothetical protein